jgi:potassium channel subfamily K, other eukaryote
MAITAYGAYTGHYNKEFNLTTIQRTLMLQTISFLIYLLAGAAVYVRIENWSYLNAVYWADYTLLTVGLGDIVPTTNVGRGLLFPYATGGIIILGLVIASIRSLVLERGKTRIKAIVEKQRQRMIKRMQKKSKAGGVNPVLEQGPTISRLSTPGPHYENDLTEHGFDLMRKVQGNAALRERWLSLLVSGFLWFILWFVGAAIFKVRSN